MAYVGWGGLADEVAISIDNVIRIPEKIPDEIAATLFITYGTAMHGLICQGEIKKEDTVVVLGAAGGAHLLRQVVVDDIVNKVRWAIAVSFVHAEESIMMPGDTPIAVCEAANGSVMPGSPRF